MFGLSFMWWALLGSLALSGLLAILWVAAIDRADDRARERTASIPTITSLPTATVKRKSRQP